MPQRPFFIAVEGIDGAGKDTLAVGLKEHFENRHNLAVVLTAEPSREMRGRRIRKILDGKLPAPPTNYGFQRLFVKDRKDHIRSRIQPGLKAGKWVISARYWLSTLAYGMLDGSAERYIELHREIVGDELILPDLTLLLDLEVQEGLRRIREDGRHFDWFAKAEKLERIRRNYLALASRNDLGRIAVMDAMQPTEKVRLEAETIIEKLYLQKALDQTERLKREGMRCIE